MSKATYALYRGDELLDVGTCAEIAERNGIKPKTVYYYSTRAYRERWKNAERRLYVVRVEE